MTPTSLTGVTRNAATVLAIETAGEAIKEWSRRRGGWRASRLPSSGRSPPVADVQRIADIASMKHASLVELLRGELSPEDFGTEIAEEVGDCISNWKSGGLGHIIITDGPMTEVTREQAGLLLRTVIETRLSFTAANYTADALIMSDDFEFADDAVNEAIFFLADDSRPPTEDELRDAMARISS